VPPCRRRFATNLPVFQKNAPRRLRLHRCDRRLWVVLCRFWSGWRRCLQMVQPDTVLRWHRRAFVWHWTRKSRRLPGRPEVAANICDLIQRMIETNSTAWQQHSTMKDECSWTCPSMGASLGAAELGVAALRFTGVFGGKQDRPNGVPVRYY